MSRLRSPRVRAVGAAVLLALAAYANSLANGFAYDDVGVIVDHPRIQSLDSLPRVFTEPYWPEKYGGSRLPLYRPITLLTLATDWGLWQGRPFGFHLMNVLWHALATALLTALLLRFATPLAAGVGGALFAVHPVHVEAVANVIGRADVIAAVATFAALLWATRRNEHRPTTGVGVATLYFIAVWTKESAIVLPALLALVDALAGRWSPARDPRPYLRSRVRVYVALVVAAAAALAGRVIALGTPVGHDAAPAFLPDAAFATRLFTMMRVWPQYLRLLLGPFDLSPDYSPAVILPAASLTVLGALGALVTLLLLAFAVVAWSRAPLVGAGILWAAVALLPVSNLIFTSGVVLAERTLYLASAGLSLAVAGILPVAVRDSPFRRRVVALAATLLLAAFGVRTVVQNPLWADTRTVFHAALRDHPESYKIHWVLGYDEARRGDFEAAFRHYRAAVLIWPHDPRLWSELAAQYIRAGAHAPATAAAQRAISLDSTYLNAHQFLALSLSSQERWEATIEAARKGLRQAGPDPVLYFVLSRAYETLGSPGAAAAELRRYLALQDAGWAAWLNVARLHLLAADTTAALAALDSARTRAGQSPSAAEALEAFRRRLRPSP